MPLFLSITFVNLRRVAITLVIASIQFFSISSAQADDAVKLYLQWLHQFQFAGYYAASIKGFFKEEGLDVKIIEGRAKQNRIGKVTAKTGIYSIENSGLVRKFAAGNPVVAIAAIFQHSPTIILSLAESEIRTPGDLVGKTIMAGGKTLSAEIFAMLRNENIRAEKIKRIPHNFKIETLISGKVDAMTAYITDGPWQLEQRGMTASILDPINYGADFYGDLLFTSQKEVEDHPNRVAAFRRATIKGWRYAMNNTDEMMAYILTLDRVKERGLTPAFLENEARQMQKLIQPDFVEIGHMNPDRWQRIVGVYKQQGIIAKDFNIDGFLYRPNQPINLPAILSIVGLIGLVILLITIGVILWNLQIRRHAARAESRLKEAISSLPIMFSLFDSNERLILTNGNMLVKGSAQSKNLLGKKFSDVMRSHISNHIISAPDGKVEEFVAKRVEQFRNQHTGINVKLNDGRTVELDFHKTSKGETFVLRRDITDRLESEKNLKDSEERFRKVFQSIPALVSISAVETGTILDVNDVWLETLGYKKEEVIDKTSTDLNLLIDPDIRFKAAQHVDRKEAGVLETQYKTKSGEIRDFLISGEHIEFKNQQCYLFISLDNTERRKAREDVLKLSQVVEQNSSMIVITDKNGTTEYVNPKFVEMSGYTAEESIGQRLSLLKSNITSQKCSKTLWRTIRDGKEWRGEVLNKRKNGETFWVSSSINPIRNEAGEITHFVSIEEDISERKHAENEMLEAKEQAEIANRSKTDFLANMSHELRTPLNAIIGFSEMLDQEIFGALANDKQKEYVETIHTSGTHLLELINDILDVSVIEAGRLELNKTEIHLDILAEAVMPLVKDRADFGGVILINKIDQAAPIIHADELRVKQILVNLLSNAIKFSHVDGTVSLSAKKAKDGSVNISISDTGIGMDAIDLAKAMEKFGQAERGDLMQAGEGTGLGLPLTKGLIEAHGGTLIIKSEPGLGTTAIVNFPRQRVLS